MRLCPMNRMERRPEQPPLDSPWCSLVALERAWLVLPGLWRRVCFDFPVVGWTGLQPLAQFPWPVASDPAWFESPAWSWREALFPPWCLWVWGAH